MAEDSTEETQFVVDEVSNIIKESIETTIGGNAYAHAKVSQWTNSVVESCLGAYWFRSRRQLSKGVFSLILGTIFVYELT